MTILTALLLSLATQTERPPPPQATRAIVRDSTEIGSDVAAYAAFAGSGVEDRLLSIECYCAGRVELHRIVRTADAVSMETDWPLTVAATGITEVRPGSPMHFMLVGLTAPLVSGETVTMLLYFQRSGPMLLSFRIVPDSRAGWGAESP